MAFVQTQPGCLAVIPDGQEKWALSERLLDGKEPWRDMQAAGWGHLR